MQYHSFSHVEISDWRQFRHIRIDFNQRLTVLTGSNGSGKSTLISLLSREIGWTREYLAVPRRRADGGISYLSGLVRRLRQRDDGGGVPQPESIGSIGFGDGSQSEVQIFQNGGHQVGLSINPPKLIDGLLIDSHRPSPTYSPIASIPLMPMTALQSYQNYNAEMQSRYVGSRTNSTPIFKLKESLISMGIFGEGNTRLGGANQGILDTFNGFNEVLGRLLPDSLGFKELAIRTPEVVLITDSGDFMLDAASGGIMTLIDIAWRIYTYAQTRSDSFVVLMDEPENHLHPSMQRTLMPRLLNAFPTAQFVIATHSPFMVSSVKESFVYVLRYDTDGLEDDLGLAPGRSVYSQRLSLSNKAANASEVLREVLGVPATMPEWVEEELDGIVARYTGKQISSTMLDDLRGDLSQLGYDEYYVDALGRLTN